MKTLKRIIPVILIAAMLLTCAMSALASGTKTFITTGSVHMREQPNLEGKKLATLPKDTILNATDFETDDRGVKWYFGSYGKKLGWVSEKYLKEVKPGTTPKPTPKPIDYSTFKDAGYYVKVTASSLNMRKEPSSDHAIIASYDNGAILYAVKTNGSWAEVTDEAKNLSGYMSMKWLEECPAPKYVAPNPVEIDIEAVEDGIYPAAFSAEDLTVAEDVVTLGNVHLFAKDTYDIVDIAQLEVGDSIWIDGEDVAIKSIERGEFVLINGGIENGGWNLLARDEDNCYVVWDLDDATTYTELGAVDLEVGENVVYTDTADLENTVEAGIEDLADLIAAGEEWGYHQYNTTIRIEEGKIVEINRHYIP